MVVQMKKKQICNENSEFLDMKVNFGKTWKNRVFFGWVFGELQVEVRLRLQNFRLRLG
jgi:hypothetical protein